MLEAECVEMRDTLSYAHDHFVDHWNKGLKCPQCDLRIRAILSALSHSPETEKLQAREEARDAVIQKALDCLAQIHDQKGMWPAEVDDLEDAIKRLDELEGDK